MCGIRGGEAMPKGSLGQSTPVFLMKRAIGREFDGGEFQMD